MARAAALMLEPIRDMTASNKATLINSITTMGLDGAGNPLGAQMKHAGDYFEGHLAGYDSPTLYACQPSFAILITDGKATSTDPVVEATKLFTLDHSSTFAGTQNVIVHVIAFALPQADKDAGAVQELKNVAIAGGGSYFEARKLGPIGKSAAERHRPDPRGDFLFRDAGGADHGHLGQYTSLSCVVSI